MATVAMDRLVLTRTVQASKFWLWSRNNGKSVRLCCVLR